MQRSLTLELQSIYLVTFVTFAGMLTSGCGSGCDYAAEGLTVETFDAVSGQRVCGANIVAVDGNYSETLFEINVPNCFYTGVHQRAGTYTITATKAGYRPSGASATVRSDDCGIRGAQITLRLTPQS